MSLNKIYAGFQVKIRRGNRLLPIKVSEIICKCFKAFTKFNQKFQFSHMAKIENLEKT